MFGLSGSVDRMALKNANLLEELAAPHTLQLVGGASFVVSCTILTTRTSLIIY